MDTAAIPNPLRVLLGGPEPTITLLWRGLLAQRPSLDITQIAAPLDSYLRFPGYFHILCIALEEWQALPASARQKHAANVDLLILAHGQADQEDLKHAHTALYLIAPLSDEEAASLIIQTLARLREGWALPQCTAATSGQLAWMGTPFPWKAAPGGTTRPGKAVRPALDGASPVQTGIPAGIHVGSINVGGDLVMGNKQVIHSTESQVIHMDAGAAKIEQKAGKNQVNITHLHGQNPTEIDQQAEGHQVNINHIASKQNQQEIAPFPVNRFCSKCGAILPPENKYCESCGAAVQP